MKFKGNAPRRMTAGAAGFDLVCDKTTVINPGEMLLVGTGTRVAIPEGFVGFLLPRSSTAFTGLMLANSCGVIDSDFRGELKFAYRNAFHTEVTMQPNMYEDFVQEVNSPMPVVLEASERIGQLVVVPVYTEEPEEVDELPESIRGENGHGSTGKK